MPDTTPGLQTLLDEVTRDAFVCLPGKKVKNVYTEGPYVLFCGHRHETSGALRTGGNVEKYAVVQERSGRRFEMDKIMILHAGSNALQGSGLTKLSTPYQGMTVYELECGFPEDVKLKEKAFYRKAHWAEFSQAPKAYTITGAGRDIKVEVYPPHQVELELTFPAVRSVGLEGGTKYEGQKSEETGERTWTKKEKPTKKEESDWSPWTGEMRKRETAGEEVEEDSLTAFASNVKYVVDGATLQLDVLELFQAGINLAKSINDLVEAVKDNVPKIGWYFDLGYTVMEGTLKFAWGWKEYTDPRAFWVFGVHAELKILELHGEIGVGVEGFQCQVQVFGRLEGEVGFSVGLQRSSPDQLTELQVPFSNAITGKLGVRSKASIVVSVEGTAETALVFKDAAFTYHPSKGVEIGAEIEWTGLKAKVEATLGPQTKYVSWTRATEAEHTLIKPRSMGKWAWPGEPPNEPDAQTPEEIREAFKKRFTAEPAVYVGEKLGGDWTGVEMEMDAVLDRVLTVVGERRHLLLTPRSVEAMALDIREELDGYAKRRTYASHGPSSWSMSAFIGRSFGCIPTERFEAFCDDELGDLLDRYLDPAQVAFHQLQQAQGGTP